MSCAPGSKLHDVMNSMWTDEEDIPQYIKYLTIMISNTTTGNNQVCICIPQCVFIDTA